MFLLSQKAYIKEKIKDFNINNYILNILFIAIIIKSKKFKIKYINIKFKKYY